MINKTDDKYKQWKSAICRNDEANKKAMLTLKENELLIDDVISRFREDQGRSMITYDELKSVEFNKWIQVNEGVKFKRVYHPTKPVFFHTEMHPEKTILKTACFGLQEHDCKEVCRIITGHLIETLESGKMYEKNDVVIYPAFYKHRPASNVYAFYEVEFIQMIDNVTPCQT